MPIAPDYSPGNENEVDPRDRAEDVIDKLTEALQSNELSQPNEFAIRALEVAAELIRCASAAFDEHEARMKKANIGSVLTDFYVFSETYDRVDNTRKEFGKKVDWLKNSYLPVRMGDENTKTVTLDIATGIRRRFTVNNRVSASMVDKDAGMQWLKDNGHGGLIQETVNASSLSSFAKSYAEDTGMDLPEHFKLSTMQYVSATKA